jgi:hypothetical protein
MDEFAAYLDRLDGEFLSPSVRSGFKHWRSLQRGRRFPARGEFDPIAIRPQLDQISLLDVAQNPLRFRLRLVGQINRERQGLAAGGDISEVGVEQGRERILTRLRLCVAKRRPVRGTYRYSVLGGPERWVWAEVVSCPLSNDGAFVDHIVSFGADFDRQPPPGIKEWP